MPSQKISFVIPVLNEAESINELYKQIKDALLNSLKGYRSEIIFVDDGSIDNSLEIIKDLRSRDYRIEIISFRKNLGKSLALNQGFRKTSGDIVVTLDADLQDDPANIIKMIEKIEEGYDLVVGWKKDRQDSLDKTLFSKFFNFFVRLISKIPLHDFNSGLKVMKREVARELSLYGGLHRFVPMLAFQRGFKICEIPIVHHPRKYGNSKYGAERLIRGFLDFLTVSFIGTYGQRPLQFFGLLGSASIFIGLVFGVYLSVLHFMGYKIGDRPLLILSVLLTITGLQLLSIGFIAEMMVRKETTLDEKIPVKYQTIKRK